MYRQFVLIKENSKTKLVTWLPTKNLEISTRLTLKDPITKEELPDIWVIKQISSTSRTKEQVDNHLRIVRKYRQHTDV